MAVRDDAPVTYDLAVIGGGINGAGIARDAAGRGLSVLLLEQHDLASATSSASTKLVHGGLRYLEYREFGLVAQSLAERETLLRLAPHIIWPLQFVMPHERHLRPAWMIAAGLFLYDHLGGWRRCFSSGPLPRSRRVRLDAAGLGAGLKPAFDSGFSYFDCWVDDARLVLLNARSAADHGADIRTRTRLVSAQRRGEAWQLQVQGGEALSTISARVLVNAAGPWVQSLLEQQLQQPARTGVRLIRGSHIVVPRLHEQAHAYILQNPDRRIVFMIPYEGDYTLIGTTDVALTLAEQDSPGDARISEAEIHYLCAAASRYALRPVHPAEVVWHYSGVRALYDDGRSNPSAVTRDYHLDLNAGTDGRSPPVLSVFGGKITTYRRLAEQVLERLRPWLGDANAWTGNSPLPGGDLPDFAPFLTDLQRRHAGLPPELLAAIARRHGSLSSEILGTATTVADLGENFGGGLYEAELAYFMRKEWAQTAEDVLWRRSKCGLYMSEPQRSRVAERMAQGTPGH
jgi:glycerol-3-phosphate dehydrogenase